MSAAAEPEIRRTAALATTRAVWTALGLGQIALLAIALIGHRGGNRPVGDGVLLPVVLLIVALGAFALRNQIFKRHWSGHAVTAAGYVTGTVVTLAALTGIFFIGIGSVLTGGSSWPPLLTALAAAVLHALNRPTGAAMQPDIPAFCRPPADRRDPQR